MYMSEFHNLIPATNHFVPAQPVLPLQRVVAMIQ